MLKAFFNESFFKANKIYLLLFLSISSSLPLFSQHSVARQWNEVLLEGIRGDYARPTVHARNLFHISAAMYDAWAIFSDDSSPYLIGNDVHGFSSEFNGYTPPAGDINVYREKAISYAAYRLILHRFADSPGEHETYELANQLFSELIYDPAFISTDYSHGSAAALGNYIAEQYIAFGLQDGSNEVRDYENQYYNPVNEYLDAESPGNPNITDPNRWQPLAFNLFIDQSGNEIPGATPEFLGPEWGSVLPFSLKEEDRTSFERDGFSYKVYHDPGPPPYLDPINGSGFSEEYKWGFSMVAVWSGHLDPTSTSLIDISPASLGKIDIESYPELANYDQFYDFLNGGDTGQGHELNPITGMPYPPQMVELGDYGRILAEFWADGPDSETPPGHWFTILNYVSDHPQFEKKFKGQGIELDDLSWDVKAYFILGGTMHDVAIAAWGIKGYYDYIRPVSAIRYMADMGQSSDDQLPNYHIAGIPLVDGHIELVDENDPLVGSGNEHLNKIKLWAWRGPDYIDDPDVDEAGAGWILAENWWPYQRPSFITPPFAGYISGHSTYSRAAAEVMTILTGDEFFPGGVGEFEAPKNEFLVFEEGPSQDITLQWATYRDASDQCSLSRIWGGIHPPADDLPGRIIGEKIGVEAFAFAEEYIGKNVLGTRPDFESVVYPNPVKDEVSILIPDTSRDYLVEIYNIGGKKLLSKQFHTAGKLTIDTSELVAGNYVLTIKSNYWESTRRIIKQ